MPTAPDNHDAHDYAERIRERLPRRLQELREAERLSMYGLARESGLSREYIGKFETAQRTLLETAYAPGARIDALAAAGRSSMSFYKALHRIRLALMDCTQRVLAREGLS